MIMSKCKLQSLCYVDFRINTHGKGWNSIISSDIGKIVPLMAFYNDSFGNTLFF